MSLFFISYCSKISPSISPLSLKKAELLTNSLRKAKQEDDEFKASPGCTVTFWPKKWKARERGEKGKEKSLGRGEIQKWAGCDIGNS